MLQFFKWEPVLEYKRFKLYFVCSTIKFLTIQTRNFGRCEYVYTRSTPLRNFGPRRKIPAYAGGRIQLRYPEQLRNITRTT